MQVAGPDTRLVTAGVAIASRARLNSSTSAART